jgi:uncharacterized protein
MHELNTWRDRLRALAASTADDDGAHDASHLDRVWRNAQAIMAGESAASGTSGTSGAQADTLAVLAACYLHDLVNVPKNDPRRAHASRLSSELARSELQRLGFPAAKLDLVAHAIEAHSFSAAIPATTLEAKIVQDADRLDGLGAVGLARMFYIAGRMGSSLAHGGDPLGIDRALDDKAYSLDHIPVKLAKLPGMMQTAAGRRLGEQRLAMLEAFRRDFAEEWSGQPGAATA